jgi:large subunit ribosomal protein L24
MRASPPAALRPAPRGPRGCSAAGFGATLDLTLQAADMSPLRRGAAARASALLPVALRARLTATADEIALDNINGRGRRLAGARQAQACRLQRIEGQIDTDAADVMALLAIAAGMPRAARTDTAVWPGEPFGESVFGDLEGRLSFSATRAALSPTLTGRQLRGTLRLGGGEVALENAEGTLAGGRASGQMVLRRSGDGLAMRAKMSLAGADAATLLSGDGRPVIVGRLGLQAEVEGSGLSPASLIGSLSGTGKIELEDAQISGLDPRAFNAAIRAVDRGSRSTRRRSAISLQPYWTAARLRCRGSMPRSRSAAPDRRASARRSSTDRVPICRSRRGPISRTARPTHGCCCPVR